MVLHQAEIAQLEREVIALKQQIPELEAQLQQERRRLEQAGEAICETSRRQQLFLESAARKEQIVTKMSDSSLVSARSLAQGIHEKHLCNNSGRQRAENAFEQLEGAFQRKRRECEEKIFVLQNEIKRKEQYACDLQMRIRALRSSVL